MEIMNKSYCDPCQAKIKYSITHISHYSCTLQACISVYATFVAHSPSQRYEMTFSPVTQNKPTHFHQHYSKKKCQQATHYITFNIFYTELTELYFKWMGIISFNSVCIIFIHVHTGIDRADIESGPFLVFLSLTKWCIWIPSRFALIFAWWLKWSAQIKQYKSVCIIINANEDEQNQFLAFTCTLFMAHLCQVYLIMGSVTQINMPFITTQRSMLHVLTYPSHQACFQYKI